MGWAGVVWNDELDISAETVFYDGKDVTNEYNDTNIQNIVIGYEIKKQRLKQFISQEELAIKAGMDQSDLSKIERGCMNPSVKMLKKIAKGLGLKLKLSFE